MNEEKSMIRKFRKKPVEIEAVRWTGDNSDELKEFAVACFRPPLSFDSVRTASVYDRLHDTWIQVYAGQWVVKGIAGEFYPIADDILELSYEPVEEAP